MRKILILNTSVDVIEAVREVLQAEGFDVEAAYVRSLRLGEVSIEQVLRFEPDLVIFDLAPPYEDNWTYFRDVFSKHPGVRDRPVLLTTTNKRAVDEMAEGLRPLELLLKPFDLEELLRRVRAKLPSQH